MSIFSPVMNIVPAVCFASQRSGSMKHSLIRADVLKVSLYTEGTDPKNLENFFFFLNRGFVSVFVYKKLSHPNNATEKHKH